MEFFGVGPLELLMIALVAFLVLGPEKLPKIATKMGSMLVQARKSINETKETVMADLEGDERASCMEKPVALDEPTPANPRPNP